MRYSNPVAHPPSSEAVKEDIWINSACGICLSRCAIRVHRVNGTVVNIEGNPDCPTTRGGVCSRGASGMMLLYDPNRVNVPLKRTNPKKGIGVDPKWQEISWDEALDTIAEKLKKIKADDPRKLLVNGSVIVGDSSSIGRAFASAFKTPNMLYSGAGMHCGNGSHLFTNLMQCAHTQMLDTDYINYYLNFGCPSGFGAYYSVTGMASRLADARRRGMKHVVIEPWMGMPGLNSDEWVPIRPGTDAAMALAMVNLLVNEYGLYDAPSLTKYTNGPYLCRADGYFVRDSKTGKPMMWDIADKKAKTYDDPTIKQVALEGRYSVDGAIATTSFTLIKEHVKKYTPEMAAEITTVPAETIRRLAREFGEAACIGQTIVIDGKELPYRPVAVGFFKGAAAHKHSALICMALELLQEVVGANNVPGGSLGMSSRCFGFPETGHPYYTPSESVDGLITIGQASVHTPWPTHHAQKPERPGMNDLVPLAGDSPLIALGMTEQAKYKLPFKFEFILNTAGNFMMTTVEPKALEKALKDDVFILSFNLFLDESTEFADIVLPDTSYLERLDMGEISNSPVQEWTWHIRQPIVKPLYQRRQAQKVILDIADRIGMHEDMYRALNRSYDIKSPYQLDPTKTYTWEEMVDRKLKGYFGAERGLEWFKENGLVRWPKKVEEIYWRPFVKARVPIYFEYFKTAGAEIEAIKKEHGIPGFDTSDFQPMPDWKPCSSYEEKRPDFDLYGIYYRVPVHTFTSTYNNPWLDEISRMDPNIYFFALNTETARKKGIKDGDRVIIESAGTGYKAEGIATLSETIHPELLAYASGGGHWAKNLPIASQKEKGVCPEFLTPLNWDYIDTVSFNLDLCVKLKITRKM